MTEQTESYPNSPFEYSTVQIISAYVSNNALSKGELPGLIADVHTAISALALPPQAASADVAKPTPAEIRKSITPEALISFIDGKGYQTLKRHLGNNGLTPAAYRTRYGLPADYPMVAANYSAKRSELAKSLGLGQQRRKSAALAA